MRARAGTGALVVLAHVTVACVGVDPTLRPGPATSSAETVAERPTTDAQRSGRARVRLEATGRARGLIRTGIADVKRLGLWDDLTRHLYLIKIDSRLGRLNVPEDGHLADTYFTGVIDERGAGALCDIMFFPTAIGDDLGRWAIYYSQGRLPEPPPSPRDFWVAVLGHELAHCLGDGSGEAVAERWEARVLAAARAHL